MTSSFTSIVRRPWQGSPQPPVATLLLPLLLLLFLLLLFSPASEAQQQQQHAYPEEGATGVAESGDHKEVHRLVVERLRQRGGGGGTWGEWSAWTPCSRSCGGGVSIQSRECLMEPRRHRVRTRRRSSKERGGSRCVGLYRRFQLCNTGDCPGGYTDFRWEQCASFNKTPFNRRYYTWAPYYDTPSSCALNCRAVGLSFYATLNQTVIDGTSCGAAGTKKCVAGMCMEVGCDGVLGSGLRLDTCGQCGGDNSTCRVIAGVYSRAKMPYGYNLIATLPPGAANITIQHIKPSSNYLALRHQAGEFFLNGNWAANATGGYDAVGTTFFYQRPERFQGDRLMATGPLHDSVDVMLFYQSTNPGIQYDYRLPMSPSSKRGSGGNVVPGAPQRPRRPDNPLNPLVPGGPASRTPPSGPVNDARSSNGYRNSVLANRRRDEEEEEKKKKKERRGKKDRSRGINGKKKRKKRFEWKVVGFSSCTETCGGGTQTTRVVCVKRKRGSEVPNQHCNDLPPPPEETVRCNLRPCPAQLVAESWGPCSVTCGLGVQTRDLSCKIRVAPDTYEPAPEGACTAPSTIPRAQVCELRGCDSGPLWQTDDWGECSSQCGLGTRHRSVSCVTARGSVPPHLCDAGSKPSTQELCDMGSCATDTWFFSAWEDRCSQECGEGIQRRRVHCSGDALDNQVTETSCDLDLRPSTTRPCNSNQGCSGKWFTGPWGQCDSECGGGRRSRSVVCVVWSRGQWKISSDVSQCKGSPRPDSTEGCSTPCSSQWYTSEWSQCSVSCEGGVQRREVKCLNDRQEPALDCTSAVKPDTRQPCNTNSCLQEQADESASNTSSKVEASKFVSDSSSSAENLDRKPSSGNVESEENWRESGPSLEESSSSSSFSVGPESSVDDPHYEEGTSRDTSWDWDQTGNTEEEDEEAPSAPSSDRSPHSGGRQLRPGLPYRPGRPWHPGTCIDRMKNCHLVYKARLCRLKYYNKLCCETCANSSE